MLNGVASIKNFCIELEAEESIYNDKTETVLDKLEKIKPEKFVRKL